jgi:hypothetical protein
VVVDVEDLAVAAPVAAEVEEDTFVLATRLGDGGRDVGRGVGCLGVEVWVGFEETGLTMYVSRGRKAEHAQNCGSYQNGMGTGLRRHGIDLSGDASLEYEAH